MRIDVIDTIEVLQSVREDWITLYRCDPDAQYFLSWSFIRSWLSASQSKTDRSTWIVLAAYDEERGRHVAFLPLRQNYRQEVHGPPSLELTMAGRKFADYTGILALPEQRTVAVAALLSYVKTMRWAKWTLECLRLPAGEIDSWLRQFPEPAFSVRSIPVTNPGEDTRQDICPFAPLPSDWDTYLSTRVSANSRQKLRRLLRKVDRDPQYQITLAGPQTIERDIKILLHFWQRRWNDRKGEKTSDLIRLIGAMLMQASRDDRLLLPVMWDQQRPVGALGIFVDEEKKALLFSIGARDEEYDGPSPGLVLHAHCIRLGIANGIRTYDFMRGNEAYKYSFGVEERRLENIAIQRRFHAPGTLPRG